jgi:hypothetical protein
LSVVASTRSSNYGNGSVICGISGSRRVSDQFGTSATTTAAASSAAAAAVAAAASASEAARAASARAEAEREATVATLDRIAALASIPTGDRYMVELARREAAAWTSLEATLHARHLATLATELD